MDAVVAATKAGAVSIIGKLPPKHILDLTIYSIVQTKDKGSAALKHTLIYFPFISYCSPFPPT